MTVSIKTRSTKVKQPEAKIGIAVLILAHDEAGVIGNTVLSIMPALLPEDAIFVVADNCTDETVKRARSAGAQVIIRSTGNAKGKGEALAWFLKEHVDSLKKYGTFVILDADSKIRAGFLRTIRENLTRGNQAMQCFVNPVHDDSPISQLAAFSDLLEQTISDRLRSKLGWSVRLRGTGMVIHSELLFGLSDRLQTDVEDIALTLLLTAQCIPIGQVEAAQVYDEKPVTNHAATQQRARWFRGQCKALWQYRQDIFKILLKGPSGWALLSSLFLRPKWLVFVISSLLAIILSHWTWIGFIFWIYPLVTLIEVSAGLFQTPERRVYMHALLYTPVFVWMWLHSLVLALHQVPWYRSRE